MWHDRPGFRQRMRVMIAVTPCPCHSMGLSPRGCTMDRSRCPAKVRVTCGDRCQASASLLRPDPIGALNGRVICCCEAQQPFIMSVPSTPASIPALRICIFSQTFDSAATKCHLTPSLGQSRCVRLLVWTPQSNFHCRLIGPSASR